MRAIKSLYDDPSAFERQVGRFRVAGLGFTVGFRDQGLGCGV